MKTKIMKTRTPLCAAALTVAALALAIPAANAALINLNIKDGADDDLSLAGPTGGAGLVWNQHNSNAPTGVLLDSTGVSTGTVTVDVVEAVSIGSWGSPSLTALESGYFQFGKGVDFTITISGLDNGGIYDLWILTRSNGLGDESNWGEFRTTNTSASGSSLVIDSRSAHNGTSWVAGQNYVLFEDIVASLAGEISFISDGRDPGEYGEPLDTLGYRLMFSGLQIEAVPEPSTALLGGLGMLALLRRRR